MTATRLARLARREPQAALEHCDLCSAPIAPDHRHLLDLESRELMCACRACTLLFDRGAAGGGHYRLVPQRRVRLEETELTDEMWEGLRLPVDIAFFLHSSTGGRDMAFYPGPMGATECLLTVKLEILETLEPDVEALLVNRTLGARQHWIVPMDDCFRLVGVIRTHWKGLTGGKDVWQALSAFFAELDMKEGRS
ncbi:MAG TPA: DUF5947 family protein [Solirubrobacteraceae bacterium]|nr:DUF5947 family protein [Solirubrobacteraceae bacterium]